MKFFFGILFVALVALATADEVTKNVEPVYSSTVAEGVETETNVRNKRGFVLSTYAAPVAAAAVPIAAPAIATPYAYTYSASLTPYSYSAYRTYAPYYAGPAFYY